VKVLVIGASRGIGFEFVRQYRAEGHDVTATARDEKGLARLQELGAQALSLELLDPSACAGLAWKLDGERFDVVIVNAGVYGADKAAPSPPTQSEFDLVMHTNVLGPMRVLGAVTDVLKQNARVVLISSRMGSMQVRTSSNGWLYRASKAALNSVLKDASIVYGGRAICVAFHPGWVKTDMGGGQADLTPEQAVSGMRGVLGKLGLNDNGRFLNHDGSPLPW
jgi:NAD(P)-dependent dehydrogenase (short-subunit alcohol dehydrogenase family)